MILVNVSEDIEGGIGELQLSAAGDEEATEGRGEMRRRGGGERLIELKDGGF